MAVAGKGTIITIAPDAAGSAGTYIDLCGLRSSGLDRTADNFDATTFCTTAGDSFRRKVVTLLDTSSSLEGLREFASAGQNLLRDKQILGEQVWFKILLDGTNGYSVPMLVTDFNESTDVEGEVGLSVSITGNGVPTIIS